MKTRTEKELLEVMLEHIRMATAGLCFLNDQLFTRRIITDEEHKVIYAYIKNNRPSKFSSWNAFRKRYSLWYWTSGKVEYRIKWLQHHIKKLS
jgi:hypothetical protein